MEVNAKSESTETQPKGEPGPIVNPGVMNLAMQSKIAREMTQIRRYLDDMLAKGFISPMTVAVTQVRQEINLPYKAQSVTLINDGANTVNVWINTIMKSSHPMNAGETLALNFMNHILSKIYLQCNPGNVSSVRILPQE